MKASDRISMNEVSIIINGVRYDAEEDYTSDSTCRKCDLREVCHNYNICCALQVKANVFFKKSTKSFER